ncbi:response regulator transcription factor [Catenulispora sp. NF23]|uniref:Response regulator transcription factor n=1 Tax=Catenulispora pinistramenti TaxID=2705254 RepID=A0ABS5KY06_9ACTN|nr:response regulator transcription factor [Catenulispora pinistramenti]MBS2538106.1 response regulator transcription factor [Catenulispora pinistramenti]MBS2550909.1 response regulator transcription factor [Catenulispora pinistramenti]
MTRILVVDDEPQILRALRINLKSRTYEVETAANGVDALACAARRLPDAVLLDLGLPDMDGVEVILGLRGWTTVPIVVLSGRADPQEKIHALDAGADDYVTKPFAMEELLARLRAVIRRHQQANAGSAGAETSSVRLGSCDIDLVAHSVSRAGEPVRLTRTEWALLEILLRHPGQLVSTARLLADVWGNSHSGEAGYLRFHMARLRRKLEDDPQTPRHLMTEYGTGYRFVP